MIRSRWDKSGPRTADKRTIRDAHTIAVYESLAGFPALQGAQVDAGGFTGQAQARACAMRNLDVSGYGLAIFNKGEAE